MKKILLYSLLSVIVGFGIGYGIYLSIHGTLPEKTVPEVLLTIIPALTPPNILDIVKMERT